MPEDEAVIVIDPDGRVAFVHEDDLYEAFRAAGFDLAVRRAGRVEPHPGGWSVDVGPLLGVPYPAVVASRPRRDEALAVERALVHQYLTDGTVPAPGA